MYDELSIRRPGSLANRSAVSSEELNLAGILDVDDLGDDFAVKGNRRSAGTLENLGGRAQTYSDVTTARFPLASNLTLLAGREKRVKKPSTSVSPALCSTTCPLSLADTRYSFYEGEKGEFGSEKDEGETHGSRQRNNSVLMKVDDQRFLRVLHVQTRVDDAHVALIAAGVEVAVVGGRRDAISFRSRRKRNERPYRPFGEKVSLASPSA